MGLVQIRPGLGTFVVEKIDPFVTTLTQVASDAVASELQLAPGATVVSRHQQRYLDDIPWSLQTSFCPMSLVETGATGLIQAADIRLTITAYPVDRNQFVMNVGSVPAS
jgi:DNA-binding GntR family transcriptional regulator